MIFVKLSTCKDKKGKEKKENPYLYYLAIQMESKPGLS